MGRHTKEGYSPVSEKHYVVDTPSEYHGTRETLWEYGRPTSQG